MDNEIVRIDRCELCGMKSKYYVRDKRINSTLTDKDIQNMTTSMPQRYTYCRYCNMTTLATTLGWSGI